ncbi:MAG: hypothetical protein ACI9QD_000007 [Thermoproteota archaeon]|jgi:hypothetical protein
MTRCFKTLFIVSSLCLINKVIWAKNVRILDFNSKHLINVRNEVQSFEKKYTPTEYRYYSLSEQSLENGRLLLKEKVLNRFIRYSAKVIEKKYKYKFRSDEQSISYAADGSVIKEKNPYLQIEHWLNGRGYYCNVSSRDFAIKSSLKISGNLSLNIAEDFTPFNLYSTFDYNFNLSESKTTLNKKLFYFLSARSTYIIKARTEAEKKIEFLFKKRF